MNRIGLVPDGPKLGHFCPVMSGHRQLQRPYFSALQLSSPGGPLQDNSTLLLGASPLISYRRLSYRSLSPVGSPQPD